MTGSSQPLGPQPEVPEGAKPPKGRRRFTLRRLERHAAMARMSWPDFWRDLGIRFLIAGTVVLVVIAGLWLFAR